MKRLVVWLRGEQQTQTTLMFRKAFDRIYHSILILKLWKVWAWVTASQMGWKLPELPGLKGSDDGPDVQLAAG